MPSGSSISGLISGMDTDGIIGKLLELEQMPIVRLQTRQNALNVKLRAWQDANTRILAVKTKADLLAASTTFDAKSIASSDESLIKTSVLNTAQAGTYYLKVDTLARAHQLKSDGFADTTATRVGTGTMSISLGAGTPTEITLTDSNNTLTGLRDAINASGAGVTASIISDGSATNPYRLVITSNTSGEVGEVTIQTNLSGGTAPVFSTMQEAQDASVTLGEGAGAVTITRSTNTITDLIPGVTLSLQSADPTKTVTISVNKDLSAIKKSINDFVAQYNNLIGYIGDQFKYDSATNTAGTLFGDSSLESLQTELTNRIFDPVDGLSQTVTVLSQIGITSTGQNYKLTVDEAKLDEVLTANIDTVKNMFANVGTATSSFVSFSSSTDKTKISGTDGYAVEITAVATRARVTAGITQIGVLAQDESLTVNGKVIELKANMNPAQVILKINEYTSQTGITASRTGSDGSGTGDYLTFTRVQYGSSQTIKIKSSLSNGGAGTSGVGTVEVTQAESAGESGTGTGAAGTDVAGTINGEAATGSGQMLAGNTGNANTEGLRLKITAQTVGSLGMITFSKGIGSILGDYLGFVTWPGTGTISNAQNSIQTQIEDINKDIKALEERVTAKHERLLKQFAIMESTLARLQGQGTFISSQLGQTSGDK